MIYSTTAGTLSTVTFNFGLAWSSQKSHLFGIVQRAGSNAGVMPLFPASGNKSPAEPGDGSEERAAGSFGLWAGKQVSPSGGKSSILLARGPGRAGEKRQEQGHSINTLLNVHTYDCPHRSNCCLPSLRTSGAAVNPIEKTGCTRMIYSIHIHPVNWLQVTPCYKNSTLVNSLNINFHSYWN